MRHRNPSHIVTALAALIVIALVQDAPAADDRPAGSGRLAIETTAACTLKIAGSAPQELAAGATREIALPPGEIAVECVSSTTPEARVALVRSVKAGASETVRLDVAERVFDMTCAGKPATFADLGGGILRHCVTKADWTAEDGGADLDFPAAHERCAKQGTGWLLPKADDLSALIDRSGRSTTACGRFACAVSPHFRLTAPTFWAGGAPPGPNLGMTVNLMLGGRHPAIQQTRLGYRALCIRPPAP